jgi:hypothetical protein
MASELLSSVTASGGGNGAALAPDLTFPSSLLDAGGFVRVSGINPTAGLTTALSLTGKFVVDFLKFGTLLSESITIKLTVDGIVVWNDTFSITSSEVFLLGSSGSTDGAGVRNSTSISCNSSLLLEIQTTTDTDVNFEYLARPVL